METNASHDRGPGGLTRTPRFREATDAERRAHDKPGNRLVGWHGSEPVREQDLGREQRKRLAGVEATEAERRAWRGPGRLLGWERGAAVLEGVEQSSSRADDRGTSRTAELPIATILTR